MNISQLLQSTQQVGSNYGPKYAFAQKQFGEIYFYNKTVKTKPGFSIIEVSMMIKAVTDKHESVHKVMLAISGVKQRTMRGETLVGLMRTFDIYKDAEAFSDEELIAIAIEQKPFPHQTVMKNEAGTYTLIDDNVSKENEVLVYCSCSNYYWAWQYYNVENNVDIFGKLPPKYSPRTEAGRNALKTNKPMRNPNRHPGMCKHIMLLLALLMDTGPSGGGSNVLKEARSITRNFRANFDRFKKVERMSAKDYAKEMRKWAREKLAADRMRGVESDPALAPKRQQKGMKHWQRVQNSMVGKRSRNR